MLMLRNGMSLWGREFLGQWEVSHQYWRKNKSKTKYEIVGENSAKWHETGECKDEVRLQWRLVGKIVGGAHL